MLLLLSGLALAASMSVVAFVDVLLLQAHRLFLKLHMIASVDNLSKNDVVVSFTGRVTIKPNYTVLALIPVPTFGELLSILPDLEQWRSSKDLQQGDVA